VSDRENPLSQEVKAKKRKFAIKIAILIAAVMLFNMIVLAWRL